MPWTVKDVDRHMKGLTDKQKRRWVNIANSVRKKCLADGGSEKECDAKAVKYANGVLSANIGIMEDVFLTMDSDPFAQGYEAEERTLNGRDYLVVPVVMIKEGVHVGSAGAVLHLAEELGEVVEAWNGIPIVLNHPKDDGDSFISANSPEVLEEYEIGRVFNAQLEGSRLKAEAWLDIERLEVVSPDLLDSVKNGEMIEVSVGVFSDNEEVEGEWNGEKYNYIAKNYRPDHLALLPGLVGACSIDDGCGIRVNQGIEDELLVNVQYITNALKYSGTETTKWKAPSLGDFGVDKQWDELSSKEKARIASHYLIGSSSAKTFGDLKLPVVNPKTGKLNEHALRAVISGRGAQVKGVPANTLSAARRRAYSLLNKEFNAKLKAPQGLIESELVSLVRNLGYSVNEFEINGGVGYREILDAMYRYFDTISSDIAWYYPEEIYDGEVIYAKNSKGESSLWKQSYKYEGGKIELIGDPTRVRKSVEYISNCRTKKEEDRKVKKEDGKTPEVEQKVSDLIANSNGRFTEEDKEVLMTLDADLLDKIAQPIEIEKKVDVLSEEDKRALEAYKKEQKEKREKLIKEIQTNVGEDKWPTETLEGLSDDFLLRLYESTKPQEPDFSLAGGIGVNSSDEILLPPGVEVEQKN